MKLKIREKKCTGCHLCQLACSAAKNQNFGILEARIRVRGGSDGRQKITVCRQCKHCKCMEACHYNAFQKDTKTGGVYIDQKECQACLACLDACPFGAINMDQTHGIPIVCDLCNGEPRCVEACMFEVLHLSKEEGAFP